MVRIAPSTIVLRGESLDHIMITTNERLFEMFHHLEYTIILSSKGKVSISDARQFELVLDR